MELLLFYNYYCNNSQLSGGTHVLEILQKMTEILPKNWQRFTTILVSPNFEATFKADWGHLRGNHITEGAMSTFCSFQKCMSPYGPWKNIGDEDWNVQTKYPVRKVSLWVMTKTDTWGKTGWLQQLSGINRLVQLPFPCIPCCWSKLGPV